MSSVFVDGDADLDASRPRSGILTPSSDTSLNRKDGISSPATSKRRGDAGAAMEVLLKPSIAVKPHPHTLQTPPRTLSPLMLLPRQHLPLASLDFDPSNFELPTSRFYEAHIKILDLESRLGPSRSVLLARIEPRGAVYAFERQTDGLYVVCKLGSWVQLETLAENATTICHDRVFPVKLEASTSQNDDAAIITPQMHHKQKQKRAAIEAIQSLVRKRAKSQVDVAMADGSNSPEAVTPGDPAQESPPQPTISVEDTEASTPNMKYPSITHDNLPGPSPAQEQSSQDLATSIFNTIRTQYFEALYKSKGSLAYFAKGPLSRARSAFHLDLEANLDMSDLIEFLKGLLLTTVQIDKKYRETAPEIIAKLGKTIESSDETRRKRRKAKKQKLGKNALYPLEDDSIRNWWSVNKPELKEDNTGFPPGQIKSHLSILRTRETQLQMILILEILALTPLKTTDDVGDSSLPTLPGAADTNDEQKLPTPQPKKRNKHNLPVLVDVHADRLTIWQSTATDELAFLEDSQANIITSGPDVQQKASNEPLKDFCIDVIVPFFSARLPELCDSINRKLGGPVIVSPMHTKSSKRLSSKRDQKPGSATKRPAPQNAQRTLQRALSTDQHHRRSVSRGPGSAIALMRSATSATVPGLKREGSEPLGPRSLSKSSLEAAQAKRSGLSRSNSVIGSADDAKAKKKALVDAQLRDAISGLRKPNRDMVSKNLEETAEHRHATGLAKKARKIQRSSSAIQVKATPMNNRFRDVFNLKAESIADTPMRSLEEAIPPSSIGPYVPSTAARNPFKNAAMLSTSPSGPPDIVGSTPTKPPASASSFLRRPSNEGPFIPPSPLFKTSKRESMGDAPRSNGDENVGGAAILFATPAKKSAPRPGVIPESPMPQVQEEKRSIYQELGWDDDLDDLL